MLGYEKLDVYRCAIDFLALASTLIEGAQKGDGPLVNQLRRAAMSVPLNIAEASGRTCAKDRARFYGVARGSAMECGAILDVWVRQGRLPQTEAAKGKDLLVRVVGMLTRLCR